MNIYYIHPLPIGTHGCIAIMNGDITINAIMVADKPAATIQTGGLLVKSPKISQVSYATKFFFETAEYPKTAAR